MPPETAGGGESRDDVLVGTSDAERYRQWRDQVFRHPTRSGLAGCMLVLASGFAGVAVGVAMVVAGAGSLTESRLGMLLLATPGLIAALLAFVVLAPLAYRVHRLRAEAVPGFGTGPAVGAVVVLVAVIVLGVVAGKRAWDARVALDGLKGQWAPVRAALLDGDLPSFRRRWDVLTHSVDRTRAGHPRLSSEIDEAVDVMIAEFDVLVSDSWERVARGLTDARAVGILRDAPRLGARPGLRARLRELERRAATHGVRLTVVVEDIGDEDDVAWFDDALQRAVQELLPDRVVVRAWPFDGPAPELPSLNVECVLGGQPLWGVRSGASGPGAAQLLVPTLLVARFEDADGALDEELPAEPVGAGPLSVAQVLETLRRRHPELPAVDAPDWSADDVRTLREGFRRELTSRLRAELGLPAEDEGDE